MPSHTSAKRKQRFGVSMKNESMTYLQKYIIRKVAEKVMSQGFFHRHLIIEFYGILIESARNEFTEDTVPTLNEFLTHCHDEALRKK